MHDEKGKKHEQLATAAMMTTPQRTNAELLQETWWEGREELLGPS